MKSLGWAALGLLAACAPSRTVPPGPLAAAVSPGQGPAEGVALEPNSVADSAPRAALAASEGETRGIRLKHGDERPPPPDWSQVSISVTIEARVRDKGDCFVMSGARLHSGDRFALFVGVARPAYVYIVQVSPDGHASVLYPEEGMPALHLEPQRAYRIPASADDTFELDRNVGREHLQVIASERPLGLAAPELAQRVADVRSGAGARANAPRARMATTAEARAAGRPLPTAAPERLPPDPSAGVASANGLTRGIILSTGTSGRALDVRADAAQVVAASLEFDHVP